MTFEEFMKDLDSPLLKMMNLYRRVFEELTAGGATTKEQMREVADTKLAYFDGHIHTWPKDWLVYQNINANFPTKEENKEDK